MQEYFYGWYLKCQSEANTIGVIPAIHGTGKNKTCSIQLITEDGAWNVEYPGNQLSKKRRSYIRIGRNYFCKKGFQLDIHTADLSVCGKVRFGSLKPLKYSIMGPFEFLPFMECRHMVYSMRHSICGNLCINGKNHELRHALGYWEGDRGRSFPKEYAWTQCMIPQGSIMLSVADIPIAGWHFTGVIGIVLWKGIEYRFATYLGARVLQKHAGKLLIRQGKMELEAYLIETAEQPLCAPVHGTMKRTIHESTSCKVFYRFALNGQNVCSFVTVRASFEYEYNQRE